MENVKKWLFDANRQTNQSVAQFGTDATLIQSHLPHVKPFDPPTDKNELCVAKHLENGVTAVVTDDVAPSDSVSNVDSRTSKKRSSAGGNSNVSATSSARIKAEADMAALIARQRLFKDKHALEEQEEQLRKRKEQLDLDMEIAASVAKVKVLMASEGSRAFSVKSNGMNSYLEREQRQTPTLNAGAETFVPAVVEQPQHISIGDEPCSHSLDSRPKEERTELQPQVALPKELEPKMQQGKIQSTQLCHQFQSHSENPAPIMQGSIDHNRLITVLEKQNEITSLLVEQQSLFFLPRQDIQIFYGDPLQFQTFMRAFKHSIEDKTHSAKDCLYFLEQYTRGQPRNLVRSCQHMPHDEGYARAKSVARIFWQFLENRFCDGEGPHMASVET